VAEFVKSIIDFAKNPGVCRLVPNRDNKDVRDPQMDLSSVPPVILAKIGELPQFNEPLPPVQPSEVRRFGHRKETDKRNDAARKHSKTVNARVGTVARKVSNELQLKIDQMNAALQDLTNALTTQGGIEIRRNNNAAAATVIENFHENFLEELQSRNVTLQSKDPIVVRTDNPIKVIDAINKALERARKKAPLKARKEVSRLPSFGNPPELEERPAAVGRTVSDADLGDYPKLREALFEELQKRHILSENDREVFCSFSPEVFKPLMNYHATMQAKDEIGARLEAEFDTKNPEYSDRHRNDTIEDMIRAGGIRKLLDIPVEDIYEQGCPRDVPKSAQREFLGTVVAKISQNLDATLKSIILNHVLYLGSDYRGFSLIEGEISPEEQKKFSLTEADTIANTYSGINMMLSEYPGVKDLLQERCAQIMGSTMRRVLVMECIGVILRTIGQEIDSFDFGIRFSEEVEKLFHDYITGKMAMATSGSLSESLIRGVEKTTEQLRKHSAELSEKIGKRHAARRAMYEALSQHFDIDKLLTTANGYIHSYILNNTEDISAKCNNYVFMLATAYIPIVVEEITNPSGMLADANDPNIDRLLAKLHGDFALLCAKYKNNSRMKATIQKGKSGLFSETRQQGVLVAVDRVARSKILALLSSNFPNEDFSRTSVLDLVRRALDSNLIDQAYIADIASKASSVLPKLDLANQLVSNISNPYSKYWSATEFEKKYSETNGDVPSLLPVIFGVLTDAQYIDLQTKAFRWQGRVTSFETELTSTKQDKKSYKQLGAEVKLQRPRPVMKLVNGKMVVDEEKTARQLRLWEEKVAAAEAAEAAAPPPPPPPPPAPPAPPPTVRGRQGEAAKATPSPPPPVRKKQGAQGRR
jgi:hypothetical protein